MEKKHLVYGKHSSLNIIKNPNRKIEKILCTQNSLKFLQENNIPQDKISLMDSKAIENILQKNGYRNALHQDVVVFTQRLRQPMINEILDDSNFLVLLDELQDSQNIGAIIRSAALFDTDAIISTEHNSPDENSHIIKAACGAFEHIPFIKVVNLSQTIDLLKKNGFWVVGMSCDTKDTLQKISQKFSKNEKIAIIVGNEEKGMRKMTEKHCDFLVTIPLNTDRGVDSLNAASATAIFLYEINKIYSQ